MCRAGTVCRIAVWATLALVPIGIGIYSWSLGQDTNWDLLNYHLYNPYAFLTDRINVDLAPAGLQTYFNPFIDVAYFVAIEHFAAPRVGFLIGALHGLNFILIYKIAKHVVAPANSGTLFALLLSSAGILSVGFLSEVGTTLHDNLIAIFPLTALWMILSKIERICASESGVISFVFWAGLILGIGVGLKLVIAIYAVGLCAGYLFLPLALGRRLKLSVMFGVGVLVGLLASGGYWYYKIWLEFGNPIFPQFNHIFSGELAVSEATRDERFLPKTLAEKIFYPFVFTANPLRVGELKYEQVSWVLAYLAVVGLVVARVTSSLGKFSGPRLDPRATFFIAFFGVSFVVWVNLFGIYRYLIPIEILIPTLLFITVTTFSKTRKAPWIALGLIGVVTAINLDGAPDWGHSSWAKTVFQIENDSQLSGPGLSAVYLAGQPLAWIVPSVRVDAPVVQLVPNIRTTEAYWHRAKELVSGREGRSVIVFESTGPRLVSLATDRLAKLGLMVNEDQCDRLVGYVGKLKHEYRTCELRRMGAL